MEQHERHAKIFVSWSRGSDLCTGMDDLLHHSGTSLRVPCNEVTRGKKQRQACKQAENLCPLKGKTQEQRNWQIRQSSRGK